MANELALDLSQDIPNALTAIGASANWNKYLTEPDYWMEIKLNGSIALIPCYNKG